MIGLPHRCGCTCHLYRADGKVRWRIRNQGSWGVGIGNFRPMTGYYTDTISEAAALMESLAINHPFIDGNKRIAFAATDVFLRINGWRLTAEPSSIYSQMVMLFNEGRFDIANIEPWLRSIAMRSN